METVELEVKSKLYGTTTCVVDVESFRKGRLVFPCGDGCDHHLSSVEIGKVRRKCGIVITKKGRIRTTYDRYRIFVDKGEGLSWEHWEDTKEKADEWRFNFLKTEPNAVVKIVKKRHKINS